MISEEEKYKAYTFNIAGFALMTPAGKVVLDYIPSYREVGLILFFINLVIALVLLIIGLTFIEQGRSILDKKRRYQNDNRSS